MLLVLLTLHRCACTRCGSSRVSTPVRSPTPNRRPMEDKCTGHAADRSSSGHRRSCVLFVPVNRDLNRSRSTYSARAQLQLYRVCTWLMGGTSARARLTLTLSSSNQQCDARRFHANDKSEREERGRDSSQSSMRLPFGWWFACPSPRAERRRVRQHTSPQLPPGIGRRKRMNTSAGRRQSAGLTSRSPRLRAGLVAHRVRWRRPSCALSPPRMPAAQNQARPSHRRPARAHGCSPRWPRRVRACPR